MEPRDASKATNFWLWCPFICLTTLLSALPAPSLAVSLHNWSCRPVAVFVAPLLYFFWGFFRGEKRKGSACQGALCLSDWRSDCRPGFSCLNGMEYSQMSLQAVASPSVGRQKTKKKEDKKRLMAAQSSTLTYLPRRKERREAQEYIILGRMSVIFQAPEETSDFGGMCFFQDDVAASHATAAPNEYMQPRNMLLLLLQWNVWE